MESFCFNSVFLLLKSLLNKKLKIEKHFVKNKDRVLFCVHVFLVHIGFVRFERGDRNGTGKN